MRAMVLRRPGERLVMEERSEPLPGPGQIRIRIEACGVCRTDLHVVDGELPNPKLPIVPGHEIVGRIEATGEGVEFKLGARGSWQVQADLFNDPNNEYDVIVASDAVGMGLNLYLPRLPNFADEEISSESYLRRWKSSTLAK